MDSVRYMTTIFVTFLVFALTPMPIYSVIRADGWKL